MSLLQLKSIEITEGEYNEKTQTLLDHILSSTAPVSVHLIGSFFRRKVTPESDIDVVLIFNNEDDVRRAQKALYSKPPLDLGYPVEYIFLQEPRFNKMKDVGGIAFEAFRHGEKIYG